MFGIRTPAKKTSKDSESPRSPTKLTHNVRRSIGEWESAKNDAPHASQPATTTAQAEESKNSILANLKPTSSQPAKSTATRRASVEIKTPPPKQVQYVTKTAEARACLNKAKLHLNNSRNLKTEIKAEVTQAIDRLYSIVKELEEGKKMKGNKELNKELDSMGKLNQKETGRESDIMDKMEEHTRMLQENNRKLDELKNAMEEQKGNMEKMTYASMAASNPDKKAPERSALHSIVVTSEEETDTGEEVLNRVRDAIDAKEGWVRVARVRKAKDRKIIMSCNTREEREQVKLRIEKSNKKLMVEEIKNKDPLIILRDVLVVNSDEDLLKAMRNQNKMIFEGLEKDEDRISIKYRRKARNPLTNHIVVSTSPRVWRRMVDAESLHIDLQHIKVADQSPLVQCSRCLSYGHSRRFCKQTEDLCCHCGGPHLRTECADWLAGVEPNCKNCTKAGLGRTEHNAFSNECAVRRRWDTLARMAIAYC